MRGRKRKDIEKGSKHSCLTFISELDPNLKPSDKDYRKGIFLCDCGNLCKKSINTVRSLMTKSCGCYAEKVSKREDMVGKRYGRLEVIKDATFSRKYKTTKGKTDYIRQVWCKCSCGSFLSLLKDARELRSGKVLSCGCLSEKRNTGIREKIYHCWLSMVCRVEERREKGEECRLFEGWICKDTFIDWSLKNGYEPGLCFCRNNDKGDYTPWNARWDTNARNVQEASGNSYKVIKPNGEEFLTRSLPTFCKNHGVKYTRLFSLYSTGHGMLEKDGWKIERLEEDLPFTEEYINA